MHLLVSNPPASRRRRSRKAPTAKQRANWARFARMAKARRKSTTRASRKRRRSTSPKVVVVNRTTTRTRSRPTMARRRTTRRRRRSSGTGIGRTARGFVSRDMLFAAATGTAAFIATSMLLPRLPIAALREGPGSVIGKVIIGVAGAYALRRAGFRSAANGFAVGAMISAGLDVAKRLPGLSGLGDYGQIDGISYLTDAAGMGLDPVALAGLGCLPVQ